MSARTAVAVSPHLDDAVFSAGGTLATLTAAGWRVSVVTCFTASVADPCPFALSTQLDKGLPADLDYMALRRAEDERALAVLGARPVHLPLPEAPHRGYRDASELFGGIHAGDEVAGPLGEALGPHLAAAEAARLLVGDACEAFIVSGGLRLPAIGRRGLAAGPGCRRAHRRRGRPGAA